MTVDYNNFNEWEQDKAAFLVKCARRLGLDLSGYGELAVNQNSGNVYLWLEDAPATLYMPISCELKASDVWVCWTNPENGEETEQTLDEFDDLAAIQHWGEDLQNEEVS